MVWGSTSGNMQIPYLPPDIHYIFAKHLYREDVPNYRLACKSFADAGRRELFNTIVVRPTLLSVAALKQITQDDKLAQCVQALIWDLTYWRVGNSVRDWHEWAAYFEDKAQNADPDQASLYKELAASREYWEAYLLRREDDRAASRELQELSFRCEVATSLPNLRTVHVFRGAHRIENRRVHRPLKKLPPPSRPLDKWRGDAIPSTPQIATEPWKHDYIHATSVGTKLRMYGFSLEDLQWLGSPEWENVNCEDITSLKVKADIAPVPYFRDLDFHRFLRRFPYLESLTLNPNECGVNAHGRNLPWSVQSIFKSQLEPAYDWEHRALRWKTLRKLSLAYFTTNTEALLALVVRHSSTLRDLRLQAMYLDHFGGSWEFGLGLQGTWHEIFSTMTTTMKLERVVFSGIFQNANREDDFWDFDRGSLSALLSACIINGGEIPIPEGKHGSSER